MTKNKVEKTIMKYGLIGHNELVIVALSGGFDSMCLLHILIELGYNVQAAHLNHSIRECADDDNAYVRQATANFGIKLYEEKIDVIGYAAENKLSLETAGRILRYEFFNRLANEHNAVIATAHNLNDNAESFIMHLLRGAGPAGLIGIRPIININGMKVIRPIIEINRTEVEEYCSQNNLNPKTDETNFSCDYWRNEIRHVVMPPIIERGGLEAISRSCEIISGEDDFLDGYINKLFEENSQEEGDYIKYSIKWFNSNHVAVRRRLIKRAIKIDWKHPVTLLHINAVIQACEKNYGGKTIEMPGKIKAHIKNGYVYLGRLNINGSN